MALDRRQIKEAVDKAMEKIADMDKVHYALLKADRNGMIGFKKEVERTVEELSVSVNNIRAKKGKSVSIHEAMPHLSNERKELIRTSLRNQTFVMSIVKHGDSQKVHITKNGEKYMPSLDLPSSDASGLQIASVVVESVALMLNLIGISVPENQQGLKKAIEIVKDAMTDSASIIARIEQLKSAYGNDDTLGIAKAIIGLAIDLFGEGIFMKIAGALLSEMHWYEWILVAAKISAFIVAMVATAGVAEVAELVSVLLDAADFMKKLANLNAFD